MSEEPPVIPSTTLPFSAQLEAEPSVEKKIRLCLEAMRVALAGPCFREFWNVRQLCLTLFKEAIAPKLRSQLWGIYIELSSESKRLKEILDEQSAFASEQIELAIQALERDVAQQEALLAQLVEEFPALAESYRILQTEIHLLSTLASRVNGLRKEALNTQMRIRSKNAFLSRLSACGDLVFPKRKQLIGQISAQFMHDVDQFIATHFHDEEFKSLPLYALREEVKQWQAVAKELTLSSPVFTETRLKLSQCWDRMREKEKERKVQKRPAPHPKQEPKQEEKECKPLFELREQVEALLAGSAAMEGSELSSQLQIHLATSEQIPLSKAEKHVLDRLFRQVKDRVQEKKTQALLALPEEDQHVLEQLKSVLEEKKLRRQEIKKQLEGYRQLLGGSSLDFEKAMLYRESIEVEKGALEQLECVMEEIEQKIAGIQV